MKWKWNKITFNVGGKKYRNLRDVPKKYRKLAISLRKNSDNNPNGIQVGKIYEINGKIYHDIKDVPEEHRQKFEDLEKLNSPGFSSGGLNVGPDSPGNRVNIQVTKQESSDGLVNEQYVINGTKYSSINEVPEWAKSIIKNQKDFSSTLPTENIEIIKNDNVGFSKPNILSDTTAPYDLMTNKSGFLKIVVLLGSVLVGIAEWYYSNSLADMGLVIIPIITGLITGQVTIKNKEKKLTKVENRDLESLTSSEIIVLGFSGVILSGILNLIILQFFNNFFLMRKF
jgi:hypothetical protein